MALEELGDRNDFYSGVICCAVAMIVAAMFHEFFAWILGGM